MQTLFSTIVSQLDAAVDRRGWAHATCPQCGKEAKRGQSHFSFSEEYGHCFVCGYSASLKQIADRVNVSGDVTPIASKPHKEQRPRNWQVNPDYYIERFCSALDRVQAWSSYKPLTLDSIARFRLGVGMLPASRCAARRLILPVFDGGRVVAFHGRAYRPDDTDAKWLTAGGSSKQVLFNIGLVQPGATVVICENYVDAILAAQAKSDVVWAAVGGATWRDEWTAQIAQARPGHVKVWLDHDLAGNGSRYHHAALVALWRAGIEARRTANPELAKRPWPKVPEPRGPKIANDLLAAGVRASVYAWPKHAPLKADIGWLLSEDFERECQ